MKLNAALEVLRIKKTEAVLLYFMDWKLALPKGETKIDRPAKHDLQLCAPVCQATFTVNYATAADIPVHVVTMARSICSLLCLLGLRILTSCDHLIPKHNRKIRGMPHRNRLYSYGSKLILFSR